MEKYEVGHPRMRCAEAWRLIASACTFPTQLLPYWQVKTGQVDLVELQNPPIDPSGGGFFKRNDVHPAMISQTLITITSLFWLVHPFLKS